MAEAKRNGMEEARIKMIYDMVHTMGLSFEEIVKKMHISSEEQHQYKQYETNMLDKA